MDPTGFTFPQERGTYGFQERNTIRYVKDVAPHDVLLVGQMEVKFQEQTSFNRRNQIFPWSCNRVVNESTVDIFFNARHDWN